MGVEIRPREKFELSEAAKKTQFCMKFQLQIVYYISHHIQNL